MAATEERCWYTLNSAAQPVGPYSISDLTGNIQSFHPDLLSLDPRGHHQHLSAPVGYAASGLVSETQVFWKEGKSAWDKLSDVPELEAVLKALEEHKAKSAAAAAAAPAG